MRAVSFGRIQRPPLGAPGFQHSFHDGEWPPNKTPSVHVHPIRHHFHRSYGPDIPHPGTRSTLSISYFTPRSSSQSAPLIALVALAVPYYSPTMSHLLSTARRLLSCPVSRRVQSASPRPGVTEPELAAPHVVPVFVVPCSAALPNSGRDGGQTYLRRHPCRLGRPFVCLKAVHVDHRERFVLFQAHDYASSVQHLGDEYGAIPRDLQLGPGVPSQHDVMNPHNPDIQTPPIDTLATEPRCRSHAFDATPLIAIPRGAR